MVGAGVSLLYHSGRRGEPNLAMERTVPFEPYYWVLPSGAPIDRAKLMVVLNNLKGMYIKASYVLDGNAQARYEDL